MLLWGSHEIYLILIWVWSWSEILFHLHSRKKTILLLSPLMVSNTFWWALEDLFWYCRLKSGKSFLRDYESIVALMGLWDHTWHTEQDGYMKRSRKSQGSLRSTDSNWKWNITIFTTNHATFWYVVVILVWGEKKNVGRLPQHRVNHSSFWLLFSQILCLKGNTILS